METGEPIMYRKKSYSSLSFRILCTVILGIICVTLTVTAIIINISKSIFVDTYGQSQEKVFVQIEEDMNRYHENLTNICSVIDTSWAFRLYFGSDPDTIENQLAFQTIYQMQKDIKGAISPDANDMSVMVIGMEDQTFISRAESIILDNEEIRESEAAQKALENPGTIQYVYASSGFTATTRNSPVLIAAKALTYLNSDECYAIVFFTMKESDVEQFYNYFVSEAASFYLLDDKNEVLSSSDKDMLGETEKASWLFSSSEDTEVPLRRSLNTGGELLSVMQVNLPYYNCTIYGVIDNNKALDRLYDITQIVAICAGISMIVLVVIFLLIRQTIRPLSVLASKMTGIRDGDFDQYMEVSGPEEVRELAITYNYMLQDLQKYVEQLLETQQEKRKSEIKALQMQINPHYVYNTLASIKWLIWQGDTEKSTKTIDAFISLLRNTISNTDEFLTVKREIQNLENYILINNTRYGEKVRVEFYVVDDCANYLLPKMILQPFVENAFFHAFPGDQYGSIQIFFNTDRKQLKIEIHDDGVGMDAECLQSLTASKERDKTEHYSGIGINNVDERLKLIYGADYGVMITSVKERGTTIQIQIPVKMQESGVQE